MAGRDSLPFVSIIVPCKRVDEYTLECVERCLQLDYEGGFEVLVVPDEFEGELRGRR